MRVPTEELIYGNRSRSIAYNTKFRLLHELPRFTSPRLALQLEL